MSERESISRKQLSAPRVRDVLPTQLDPPSSHTVTRRSKVRRAPRSAEPRFKPDFDITSFFHHLVRAGARGTGARPRACACACASVVHLRLRLHMRCAVHASVRTCAYTCARAHAHVCQRIQNRASEKTGVPEFSDSVLKQAPSMAMDHRPGYRPQGRSEAML